MTRKTLKAAVVLCFGVSLATLVQAGDYDPAAVEAQKGGGCKDIAIRWFAYPVATLPDGSTVPSAISGDGGWYTGGSIHKCGSSRTNDATIKLTKSRRLTLVLPSPVGG